MIYSINMNYCTCMYMYMYSSYKMYNSICIICMYYSIHCMYVNVLHVHVCTCYCIIHVHGTCTCIIINKHYNKYTCKY